MTPENTILSYLCHHINPPRPHAFEVTVYPDGRVFRGDRQSGTVPMETLGGVLDVLDRGGRTCAQTVGSTCAETIATCPPTRGMLDYLAYVSTDGTHVDIMRRGSAGDELMPEYEAALLKALSMLGVPKEDILDYWNGYSSPKK